MSDEDIKKKRRWFGLGKEKSETETLNEETAEQAVETTEEEAKPSFFKRLTKGLSRSSGAISEGVTSIFTKARLDSETLQELEDVLITADLGVETTMAITGKLAKDRFDKEISAEEIKSFVAGEVAAILKPLVTPFEINPAHSPHVVLMVGVNGAGKTTTIGKMAHRAKDEGLKVMLAAGDTFRAAAIDQLKVWGERVGAPVIARDVGADAAGLAFDALERAKHEGVDVLFIDTAGRLQNKTELMAELEKITRVIKKLDPTAPHSVLLVLDATTGQNALNQAKVFTEIAGVTGLIMTKLDGTARGGILVAVAAKQGLPIHAIGVGESIEDFQPFDADDFAKALVGLDSSAPEPAQ
ncbi:MAG: signal recognition particle-docking protein FtsY [Alphaproteobacteria bacterium]|nr:MAG: signal recognition particle-docking protein FtsY [Alphaproteobacteria bacterium]